jgi:AcrR family transcriptional regulator
MPHRPTELRQSTRRPLAESIGGGRERLLEAAVRLFAANGYAATSVRDIVRAAGVTAPALYHHFGNKEGLFLAIVGESQSRVEAARQEALGGGGTAAARILRLGRTYLALRRELADVAWAIGRAVAGPPHASPRLDVRSLTSERIRHFEALVDEGVSSGEFRPCAPRHVALALVGVIEIASHPHWFDPGGGGSDEALEGMLAVILSGIAAGRA